MPFNVLLLPLLGGFLFITFCNRTRFGTKRLEKERLLLYAALAGMIQLVISFSLSLLIKTHPQALPHLFALRVWWADHVQFDHSGIAFFAFLLGFAGLLSNFFWKRDDEAVRAILNYGGPLERLLYKAIKERKRVMISLRGGKVYIGRVVTALGPENDKAFYLLTTKSGYREETKHRLVITTDYENAYQRIEQGETDYQEIIRDFGVVIPVNEVVGASLYRDDVHAKYFEHEPPPIGPYNFL